MFAPTLCCCLQAKGRPYSIVFVGVNGVGKSTNLAKVGAVATLLCTVSMCASFQLYGGMSSQSS